MKSDGSGVFTTPSIFGETSAEVCGVYGVNGTGGGDTTLTPTIKCGSETVAAKNKGTISHAVAAGTYNITVTNAGTNTYINDKNVSSQEDKSYSITVAAGETKCVRVITQSGTNSPYVAMIKITGR